VINSVLLHISKRFRANHLTVNVERTNVVRFTSTKLVQYPVNLVYSNQTLTELDNLKFLGLHTESHFMWKSHIDLLLKLSIACFIVKKIIPCIWKRCYLVRLLYILSLNNKVWYYILRKFNQCK